MKVITTPLPASDPEIMKVLFEALDSARKKRVVAVSYAIVVDDDDYTIKEYCQYSQPGQEEALEEAINLLLHDAENETDEAGEYAD